MKANEFWELVGEAEDDITKRLTTDAEIDEVEVVAGGEGIGTEREVVGVEFVQEEATESLPARNFLVLRLGRAVR